MLVPVVPAPSRRPSILFLTVTLAVTALQILLNDAALWRALGIGIAAGIAAGAITWVLDRHAE